MKREQNESEKLEGDEVNSIRDREENVLSQF